MAKEDLLLPQNLLKFNFFGCFICKFLQTKKLISAKNGSPPPSVMDFISFYKSSRKNYYYSKISILFTLRNFKNFLIRLSKNKK